MGPFTLKSFEFSLNHDFLIMPPSAYVYHCLELNGMGIYPRKGR